MWEERFSNSQDYVFGTEAAAFLRDNLGWLTPGARTLCVADGEGRNSVFLAECGLDVSSFDLSPTAIGRARDLAEARGVALDANVSVWESWDWAGPQWDLVVAIFVQFTDPQARVGQFEDLKRALRPGGRLMLHGYTPKQVEYGTGGPPDPARMYTSDLLRESFAGWHIERLAEYEKELDEGAGHSGRSALIDLIASKPRI
ncbi:MAG: class I SAM-dependent methyltransferase [Pseudomonadota bacterium]